jgi:hypothetical protein
MSLMVKLTKKQIGDRGEDEIVELIPCPNCTSRLMKLPQSYPLYDLLCSSCTFRVQVKTSSSNPTNTFVIRSGGWKILEHWLKAGQPMPQLIVNFHWVDKKTQEEKREVRFYPFIWRKNVKPRIANIKSQNRKHEMYDFNLRGLVYYILYPYSSK